MFFPVLGCSYSYSEHLQNGKEGAHAGLVSIAMQQLYEPAQNQHLPYIYCVVFAISGPKGCVGAKGSLGVPGLNGMKGDSGGDKGEKGDTGMQGKSGDARAQRPEGRFGR